MIAKIHVYQNGFAACGSQWQFDKLSLFFSAERRAKWERWYSGFLISSSVSRPTCKKCERRFYDAHGIKPEYKAVLKPVP